MAIWRVGSGWLGPVRVQRVTKYYYEVVHNGRLKTSAFNRTKRIGGYSQGDAKIEEKTVEKLDDSVVSASQDTDDEEGNAHIDQDLNEDPDATRRDIRGQTNRIPRVELQRVLKEASPLLQGCIG